MSIVDRTPGTYYFTFQFYAHDIGTHRDFHVRHPAVAIRFLDFPTLLIRAAIGPNNRLQLGAGKKCSFKMHSEDLNQALLSKPCYVMFVDADPKQTTILGSCTLNLGLFTRDQAYFNPLDPSLNVKRSVISLFDQVKAPVGKIDSTITLSLLDKPTIEDIEQRE